VYVSKKSDIPLIGSTYHYQVVCHQSILDTSYFIQNWKSFLEGHLPTPYIIPKTDPGPITQDKSGIATKQAPPLTLLVEEEWFRGEMALLNNAL